MLVLSRKPGERVTIGQDIRVTIVSVRGDYVKLGFEAPADVPVHREEVARRIAAERPRAPSLTETRRAAAAESPYFVECA